MRVPDFGFPRTSSSTPCTIPVASFETTPSPATGNIPLSVEFTDTSINSPTSWLWTITGGTEGVDYIYTAGDSTSQNPTVRFDTEAIYEVSLTATNLCGSNISAPDTVTAQFSPLNISGLLAWYNASNVIKDGGNAISEATDLSGNGNNVSQSTGASQPIWVDNILNGNPIMRFAVLKTLQGSAFGILNQPFTIFVVANSTDVLACYVSGSTGADVEVLKYNLFSGQSMFAGSSNGGGGDDSSTHILGCKFNVAASKFSLDGNIGGVGNAGTNSITGVSLGSYQGLSEFLNGDMAEILIYNSALSDSNLAKLNNYLNQKYAIY